MLEFQICNPKAKEFKNKDLSKNWKNIKSIFQHQGLFYVLEIIYSKIISQYHNNLIIRHFKINKTKK